MSLHLCGGWSRCPRCPRIYCACALHGRHSGHCYSCGSRIEDTPANAFRGDPREVVWQNGATSLRYVGEPDTVYHKEVAK